MWSICALLWMHSIIRRRFYIMTLMDYLSPIVLAVVYYYTMKATGTRASHTLDIGELGPAERGVHVLFAPENNVTSRLMEQVGARLGLRRLDHLPDRSETGYFAFSNVTPMSMLEYSKGMSPMDAIVIFENIQSGSLPLTLNYTIRVKTDATTHHFVLNRGFDVGLVDTNYQSFTRLQWAIDSSYLQLLTGSGLEQILTLQELPYGEFNVEVLGLVYLYSFVIVLSLTTTFAFLNMRLTEEKNRGVHEIIKIAGVSWEAISLSHALNVVPNLVIWVAACVIYFEVSEIFATSTFIIGIALALHFMTIVAFSFVFVYVFNLSTFVIEVSMLLYFALGLVAKLIALLVTDRMTLLLCCLLPHVPLSIFWSLVGDREAYGDSVTLSNMWSTEDERSSSLPLSVGGTILAMPLQMILYLMFAWYLAQVHPGKHGQAMPWNFLCLKEYWLRRPRVEVAQKRRVETGVDQRYFEKSQDGLPIGIQMTDIYKVFGREEVLHGVTMAAHKGEITVLLGHNGAGKTTLISIITGLISATSGRVLVEGLDTREQAREVRKRLGQCPQQDVLFDQLNVIEHVMFFAMIRGQTYAESKASAMKLLTRLNLKSKATEVTFFLSGGMKRRTQLACALAGNASVLLLDEPTSGLDVETRREIWNLLLNLRGDHTVLMTTHYMEEADALGDRVVALRHGVVQCHGTPMFLKRAIGTGYRLSLTTIGVPKEAAITSVIQRAVPDATVLDQRPGGISYSLPSGDTSKFTDLFTALEEARAELGIDTIGVGRSSLEEVFVQLCSDEKPTLAEGSDTNITEPEHRKASGRTLRALQFKVLLLRQCLYVKSQLRGTLFFSALIIVGLGLITAFTTNKNIITRGEPASPDVDLNLDLYAGRARRRAMVHIDNEYALAALRAGHSGVDFEVVPDVTEAALRTGRQNPPKYRDYLVGIELNTTNAKALYTKRVGHAAPVAVNLLSNTLAAWLLAADGRARTVSTRSAPLRGGYLPYDDDDLQMPKHEEHLQAWVSSALLIIGMYLSSFLMLPYTERKSLTRHSLLMTGCPLMLYWAATLTAMLIRAVVVCILPLVVFTYALEKDHTIDRPGFTVVLCTFMVVGSLAYLGLGCFLTTLPMKMVNMMCIVVFQAYTFCLCTPHIQLALTDASPWYSILIYIPYVLAPMHTLVIGLSKAAILARANAFCNLNRDKCHVLDAPKPFEAGKCCDSPPSSEPFGYWGMGYEEAGRDMLILVVQFVVYMFLTSLSDMGVWGRLHARMRERGWRTPRGRCEDPSAGAEATYVEKIMKLPKTKILDDILCHKLVKNFPKCTANKAFFAVKGISFSIKKGECFGLVGVNGAGKSTTFKMLTREICPSQGDIFAHGHNWADRSAYMETLSYCPQFSSLDEFLTGYQNLVVVLTLRGLSADDARAVANSWIAEVGLKPHAQKVVSSYSGGCARRLAAAAALSQRARTAVVDEATAGVDPVARRRLHRAMRRASRTSSLIVASHSLDEIEALCHRIGIMSAGELCALGTAAALKAQHAAGYSVVFKLSGAQFGPDGDVTKLNDFKADMQGQFQCTLDDQHLTTLCYHIKDRLPYSQLFNTLEGLKQRHPGLVEDYSVTETTLEEVFLTLAKKAHPPTTASIATSTTKA